nr:DUF2752 domain-containing protein [Flavobacterium sp. MC2016-06]
MILIIAVFLYSYISRFLNFGLRSSCETLPLVYCKSRGLTRAFSQILQFEFKEALLLNPYSLKIFLFFLVQLILRFYINSIINFNNLKLVLRLDVGFSIVFYIFCFYNLIVR